MRIVSWNVNGIRAALRKGFMDFVACSDADVICLQEVRAQPEQVDIELPGYAVHWNAGERKGYAGTAVFTRVPPADVAFGMGIPKHEGEGRAITATFPDFHLVNVYTPNSGSDLRRLEYRTQEWDVDFLAYLQRLREERPVVFCGDLNVAHREIDIANPDANDGSAGFTLEERAGFGRILDAGFTDTFREFTSEGGHYTWWSYKTRARSRNEGWRLDYFCISEGLRPRLKDSTILADVMGSDHCPIAMEIV